MTSTSVQYVADLILLAAGECMDFFGKSPDGYLKLPRRELKIDRLEQIENPETSSESRPNAIGTNGRVSILEYTEQIPDPGKRSADGGPRFLCFRVFRSCSKPFGIVVPVLRRFEA